MRASSMLIFLGLFSVAGFSAVIHVPGDHPTIQQAIDAAMDGDIVLVAPDTYAENINFLGKAITVRSEMGPEFTVIDGGQAGSVVTFDHTEGIQSVLEGFQLTNGDATSGGGIRCSSSASPWIRNNIIDRNTAKYGGGIYCDLSMAIIEGNIISWNFSDAYGGGMCSMFGSPAIVNNVFLRNRCKDGAMSIGGGIYANEIRSFITNNIFYGNKAEWGGGINLTGTGDPKLTNNTIFNNTALYEGGGLRLTTSWDPVEVVNTIFWNNSAPDGHEIRLGGKTSTSSLSISYCDVMGGQAEISVTTGSTLTWGPGMIDANPSFVNATGKDLHLTHTSPCRNTGNNAAPGIHGKDMEGDPRIAAGTVDMGADEFYRHLYYRGEAVPGGSIEAKIVGPPGAAPVGLWLGAGVADPPLSTPYGPWYLLPPWFAAVLFPVPSNGVLVLPAALPLDPLAPYEVPMQSLVGNQLTNLCVLRVTDTPLPW
jgi:parallel beta-helix repeat protein/predicted outer membrane repeat protein